MIKKFNICNRTYNVEFVDFIKSDEDETKVAGVSNKDSDLEEYNEGRCYSQFQKLVIAENIKLSIDGKVSKKKIHEERINSTVCHEIAHSWMEESGYEKLNDDETFICALGNCLYEFLKTAEYIKI